MASWFDGLTALEQFLLAVAVFSTLVFALQFVMSLLGLGGHHLIDIDSDNDGLSLGDVFTLRNGVCFLMGFSWGGLMADSWGLGYSLLDAMVGFLAGSTLVAVNMGLLVAMSRLRHDGSIQIENAIAQHATVTLSIPARRGGIGKVMVPIQGRLTEYQAVTDGDVLRRHTAVIVRAVAGSRLVVAALPHESAAGGAPA